MLCEWGDVGAKMAVAGRPHFVGGRSKASTLVVYPVGYTQQILNGQGEERSVSSMRIPVFGKDVPGKGLVGCTSKCFAVWTLFSYCVHFLIVCNN